MYATLTRDANRLEQGANGNRPDRPAWLDEQLYPFKSRFIEIEGHTIHYVDEGQGPVLLFLHANPAWSFIYRKFIAALRDDFRTVALDYPGFGLSTPAPGTRPSLTGYSRVVERFVEALGLSDVTLVMHDTGVSVGMGLAVRRPEWFRGFVISNGFAWPLSEDPPVKRFVATVASPPVGFMIRRFDFLVRYFVANVVDGALSESVRLAYRGPFLDGERRRFQVQLFQSILRSEDYLADLSARVPVIADKPTLILFGDQDATYEAGWEARYEETFPNHRTVTLEGANHFPQEDAPDVMIDAIRKWYATDVMLGGKRG